jgi:hypothetical protein
MYKGEKYLDLSEYFKNLFDKNFTSKLDNNNNNNKEYSIREFFGQNYSR